MAIGFDFGTATCSVAHIVDNEVCPIPLSDGEQLIASTLCATNRETVSEYLYRHLDIQPVNAVSEGLLRSAINANKYEGIDVRVDDICFGDRATQRYLEDPTDYYYVKSPKSFLGMLGLDDIRYAIFEDIVCAMMANVKQRVESQLQQEVDSAVIGRPVTFNDRGGEKSNEQAIRILTQAAVRAGFKHIEFQFEPVAAGLEYESHLTEDQNVLIVDIGGGTSDCSLIRMGPEWVGRKERSETLLGHTGCFTGGNDLDIHLANKCFMTEFGKGTDARSGVPLPGSIFWEPIAINDVEAQRRFYARNNLSELKRIQRDAQHPEKLQRLIDVYDNTLGYSLVAEAEKSKIALSTHTEYTAALDLPAEQLQVPVTTAGMEKAVTMPVRRIRKLVEETIAQASAKPDVVYITGGSARSPLLRRTVQQAVGDIPLANGDYFGSVTAGLARWADACFR